ncbi:hypothetical protein AB0J94_25825 [Micromonospora noduli]|uniref:hypothetical protein n=1 Tax=Micromonospora noduli TaxID=709876 RepID=UPI00142E3CE4|nr:hypothetical protein [Micromonospora noduli]
MLLDDLSYSATEVRVAHIAHPLGFEDRVGKAVRVAGRGLAEPKVLFRGQAEAQLDAQLFEDSLDFRIPVITLAHEEQRGGSCRGLPILSTSPVTAPAATGLDPLGFPEIGASGRL